MPVAVNSAATCALIYYLRQRGYVFIAASLLVC